MKAKSIVFLHLSDIHFESITDISLENISKIADSLRSYKDIYFDNIIIVVSGDITQSGTEEQFTIAKEMMGRLIVCLNNTFHCKCVLLLVPGNHDVDHSISKLEIEDIKQWRYAEHETDEFKKLAAFYQFAQKYNCFQSSEVYCDIKEITIDGIRIRVNLINNAIFSTMDQYKGLLYITNEQLLKLSQESNCDFTISVMHHAPDFYRDDIKNQIEDTVIKNSSILFHGHEHYNYSKQTSFDGSSGTIVQSGGSLCNKGNWSNSSYFVGVLNVTTLEYKYQRFTWNSNSMQYEHDTPHHKSLQIDNIGSSISSEFIEFLDEDEYSKYYVFPSMIYHGKTPTEDYSITSFERLKSELIDHQYSVIIGASGLGKTTVLKQLFKSYIPTYYVLFGSPEKLLEKSKTKRHNMDKLIKALFEDVYGIDESKWQTFERADRNQCIFIWDDFAQIDGFNISEFINELSNRFGTIILSNSRTIDFDPYNINIEENDFIARFEIKVPFGEKRRELIRSVVNIKANDKNEKNVETIVHQIDLLIRTQMSIIPPEPYYIIQMAESFMNNIGEAVYKHNNVFSKVFEANLTNKIDNALKSKNHNSRITVELIYTLFGKIAYYIHFHKAYPVSRSSIDQIVAEYNREYGNCIETEAIIQIAKTAKIITTIEDSQENYRFCNKSILAYFVAKEIISRKDYVALSDTINKACFNICTDILMFVIYLTDETYIIEEIISFISKTVTSDSAWTEFSIPDAIPDFINNTTALPMHNVPVDKKAEKAEIERNEEVVEEKIAKEFVIKDIYDWDDAAIEKYNNKLFRMTSLLQLLSKCLPCFEHNLKKDVKEALISMLYTLPNSIFMFWSSIIDQNLDEIVNELKLHPYFTSKKIKESDSEKELKVRSSLAVFALNVLLNLYYIPVLNASGRNTFHYLTTTEFFNYMSNPTYQLEQLMFTEQMHHSNIFISSALALQKNAPDHISSYLLQCIVRHGIITRNDSKEEINRLESKFFPQAKKTLLIEHVKEKRLIK